MLKVIVASLVVIGTCGVPARAAVTDTTVTQLMSKNLVDIGGRRLNLVCVGTGSPTVIFEMGLGSNLLHWQKIAGPVSKITRACFYDRGGNGVQRPI